MNVRNKDAETAFDMAMKLVSNPSEEISQAVWDKCHKDETVQRAVSLYLYSSFDYAPKALHKLHTKLVELVGEVQ
jgi:hypothetical protein